MAKSMSSKGNKVVRPMGLKRDQKPGKGPKPKKTKGTVQGAKGIKVTPKPVTWNGKTVYQPK